MLRLSMQLVGVELLVASWSGCSSEAVAAQLSLPSPLAVIEQRRGMGQAEVESPPERGRMVMCLTNSMPG